MKWKKHGDTSPFDYQLIEKYLSLQYESAWITFDHWGKNKFGNKVAKYRIAYRNKNDGQIRKFATCYTLQVAKNKSYFLMKNEHTS